MGTITKNKKIKLIVNQFENSLPKFRNGRVGWVEFWFLLKLIHCITVVCVCLMFCGCWDKVEMEKRGFVVSIGIDKNGEESGKDKPYAVSVAIADTEAISGKASDEDKESLKESDEKTFVTAMRAIDNGLSQSVYYGHAKLIVLGKDFLEDIEMMKAAVDSLLRNSEINQKIIILATDGKSSDILDYKTTNEPLIGLFVSNYYKNSDGKAADKMDLEKLAYDLSGSGCAVIPKISVKDKKIELGGAAVIKDCVLKGWLDEDEARGFYWFGGKTGASVTAEYDGASVPFYADKNKNKVSFYEKDGGGIICRIDITVSGSIEEFSLSDGGLFDNGKISELQKCFEEKIHKETEATFVKLYRELETDGFALKDLLRKKNKALYEKYISDWETVVKEIELVQNVKVTVTNAGAIK